jgi:hypothetical protein
MYMAVSWCKYVDVPSEVTVSFVDTLTYTLPTTIRNSGIGCRTENIPVLIPQHIIAGKYHLNVVTRYDINHFRTARFSFVSTDFNII